MEREIIFQKLYHTFKLKYILTFFFIININLQAQEKGEFNFLGDSAAYYNAEQIFQLTCPALVSIWYYTESYYDYWSYKYKDTILLNGSGFIFMEDGIIGTNYHVVDGIDSIIVKTYDGSFYNAELLLMDEKNDLAIIRIKNPNGRKFPVVKIGNSNLVKVGQEVFAIGSPLGYEYTISQGIVAGIRENEKVSFTDPKTWMPVEKNFEKVIQITAAISPGNSGGALFNRQGEVIGITTYTYGSYGNLNFAVAINSFMYLKSSVDLANIDMDEEAIRKREENLFFSNLRLANTFKSEATYNWYYVKQRDTMSVLDSFVIKQDSIAKMNFAKSEKYYLKCMEIAPDSFQVYQELMDLYVATENFNKAENLYDTIKIRFESDSLLSLLSSSLASAYNDSREYRKALIFYNKMSEKDPEDVFIRYQIANIYEKMGKYKKAEKEYKRIIKKYPDYIQAYMQLGYLYYKQMDDYKSAKKYLEEAYEREISMYGSTYYLDLLYYLGMIAVIEGRKIDAMLYYMELKSIYTYTPEENKKKIDLLKAIKKM